MMAIIYHNLNLIPIPNPSYNNLIYQKEEMKEFKQNYQNAMMNELQKISKKKKSIVYSRIKSSDPPWN